jgi:DNA-binding LacI/PurR family transcriptional regulator
MLDRGRDPNVLTAEIHESKRIVQFDEPAYLAVKSILPDLKAPFALFASNAIGLAGIWRAISEAGIEHHKFALACFDDPYIDIPDDVLIVKAIQPVHEISKKSLEIVMSKRNGNNELNYITIVPEIHMSHVHQRSRV